MPRFRIVVWERDDNAVVDIHERDYKDLGGAKSFIKRYMKNRIGRFRIAIYTMHTTTDKKVFDENWDLE